MANKRLLYLDDLYNFYSSKYKRSTHFSSKDDNNAIVVQVHGNLKFDDNYDKNKDGLRPVHLQACHTGVNINGSNISKEVMDENLDSFKNRPILGYIHEVDGQLEFYKHNMYENEDGELVYDEFPVGIIPETNNASIVYDEEQDKYYVEVDGYLYEEYSKAVEILEREQKLSVSVELSIRELSYNAKEKYLDIEDFWFSGVTILGKTPDGEVVNPGMQGSNIKLSDFSAKNNSLFSENIEQKMIEFQERLEKIESACFNKEQYAHEYLEEGGIEESMNKFEELLTKYNKTVEDIDFEYENMSDDELESKFEELFGEVEDETVDNSDNGDIDSEPSEDETVVDNEDSETEVETEDEVIDETTETEDETVETETETEDETDTSSEQFSLIKGYELSHDDIRYALYNLLYDVENSDNEWYYINEVYDSHFVYSNWDGDKIYGQGYVRENDNIAFDGERYELYRELLTASEKAELDAMRSTYASLVEFKENVEKNELHSKRETILANEKYSCLSDNESFKDLVKNMDKYSLEDLEKEAKVIFADSFDETTTTNKVLFNQKKDKKVNTGAYGTLFK